MTFFYDLKGSTLGGNVIGRHGCIEYFTVGSELDAAMNVEVHQHTNNKGAGTNGIRETTFTWEYIQKRDFLLYQCLLCNIWHESKRECDGRAANTLFDNAYKAFNIRDMFICAAGIEDDIFEE
jgi:hypothetical protein